MSFVPFAYTLTLFWVIVHALHRIFLRHSKGSSLLPSGSDPGRRRVSDWNITVQFLHARVETSRWNEVHDKLLTRLRILKARREVKGRLWLERIYAVGLGVGLVGMFIALGLLVWTTWSSVKLLSMNKTGTGAGKLMKRDELPSKMLYQESAPEGPITLILPGVTVPLGHTPFIITALFISQVFHELGHAVAGALYGVPVLSSGVSLVVCIPAAFVSFSAATLDTLRPAAKARITAAGPFHNLLFWCLCLLAGYVGGVAGGIFLPMLGYKDVTDLGRVVIGVDEASPLAGHVMPGTIVTKLNDYPMVSSAGDPDPWNSFLKSVKTDEVKIGWCVDSMALGSSAKECCRPDERTSPLSCFMASATPIQLGCLDPVPILTTMDDKVRCTSEDRCKDGFVCARPAEKENLLRLTVRDVERGSEKVVLWTGPWQEIYDEVTVGKWFPRFSFLPNLPLWLNIFWEYMLMVNLSLFLFNLLPISGLDGSYFLRSIVASFKERGTSETYDLGILERGDAVHVPSRGESRAGFLELVLSRGAGILITVDLVSVIFALLRAW